MMKHLAKMAHVEVLSAHGATLEMLRLGEKQCCHDEHCEPLADGTVRETSKGFKVPSGELLPYADSRLRQSHDMRFHWCHAQKAPARAHRDVPSGNRDITICLYVPPKSF
jgi:hypothetical protein